jgi:hypothetical protein
MLACLGLTMVLANMPARVADVFDIKAGIRYLRAKAAKFLKHTIG